VDFVELAQRFDAIEIRRAPAGWDTISDLSKAGVPDSACTNPAAPTLGAHKFGTPKVSPATNDEGLATITDMPVQAYLVCETTTPGNIVQKAKPFVVTIPHPNTAAEDADGKWLYDVHAYPKNQKIEIDKQMKSGVAQRKTVTVRQGDDIYEKSGGRDIYAGYIVNDIYCGAGEEYVDFTSRPEVLHNLDLQPMYCTY